MNLQDINLEIPTVIRVHHYGTKLSKHILMVFALAKLLNNKNNQEQIFKAFLELEEEFNDQTTSSNQRFHTVNNDESFNVKDFFEDQLNQSLVYSCSIFEAFIIHCLNVILYTKPATLNKILSTNDLNINTLVNFCAGEDEELHISLLEYLNSTAISKFEFLPVEKKLKMLGKDFNLPVEEIFTFSNHKEVVKNRFRDGKNMFREMFKKRNEYVHKDIKKIKKIEELLDYGFFVLSLMIELSIIVRKKYKVSSDLI